MELKDLKQDKRNYRKHNDRNILLIRKSVDECGLGRSVVIDKNNEIVAGNGLVSSISKNTPIKVIETDGSELVVVKRTDLDTDDEKRKKLAVMDNSTSDSSEFDLDLLTMDFDTEQLGDMGIDIESIEEEDKEIIEDEVPEEVETRCKKGDIWKLGSHRLMCGDSTIITDVEKLMGQDRIKCLFTSPPYNMGGDMYENYTDNLKSEEYIKFNLDVVTNWKKWLSGYLFWNISYNKNSRWEFIEIMYKLIKETGLRFLELILWDKGHGIPIVSKDMLTRQYEDILLTCTEDMLSEELELFYLGTTDKRAYFNKKKGKGITNLWKVGTGNTQLDNHKACFPVNLPAKAIKLTTDEGDIVADCFGGSGSTLIACEQLNRKCYMMEFDEHYCDIIIQRWENLTGNKAERIEDENN